MERQYSDAKLHQPHTIKLAKPVYEDLYKYVSIQ